LSIVDEEGYYKHKPPIWQGLMHFDLTSLD